MTKIKTLMASVAVAALVFSVQGAQAHCDSIDGPVATGSATYSQIKTAGNAC